MKHLFSLLLDCFFCFRHSPFPVYLCFLLLRFRHLLYFDLRSKFSRSAVLMSNLQSALQLGQTKTAREQKNRKSASELEVSTWHLLNLMRKRQKSGHENDSVRGGGSYHYLYTTQMKLMFAYLHIYLFGVALAIVIFLGELIISAASSLDSIIIR